MTSILAGSLARTISSALGSIFLPATLARDGATYPCKAIYEEWGKYPGAGGVIVTPNVKALVLATSLSIEPAAGDVVTLQGSSFVVVSHKDPKLAVTTDPARATYTLVGALLGTDGAGNGGTAGQGTSQAAAAASMAATAAALGQPYKVYRWAGDNPLSTVPVETTPVVVTSAKAAGYSYTRSSTFEDLLFALQADFSNIQIGDYLVGSGGTFFIADMPSLRPVVAVQCNGTATLRRLGSETSATGGRAIAQPSQAGGRLPYFGQNQSTSTAGGPGEVVIRTGIPCAMQGTTGRATGVAGLPSEAPGPSRWRIYLPRSAFPKGSVRDRDTIEDDQFARYMTSAADWTPIGYRLETVRLEA